MRVVMRSVDKVPRVPVEVRPVESRSDLKRFVKLPAALYRNEPGWVPPLIIERMQFLDKRKNPFFEHAEAEYFIAYRDGEPVGRISAHIDEDLNEFHDNRWGLFGFFECAEDPEAARAFRRLRGAVRDRIENAIDGLATDPCPRGAAKLAGRDDFRIRVGDYRIVYAVDDAERLVLVARIAHRREVYRR